MADIDVPHLARARRQVASARAEGGVAQVAHAEVVLGAALHEVGQVALAHDAFERSEAAYLAAGDERSALAARLNRALTLSGLGRAAEAEALYEAAATAAPDDARVADALHGLFTHHDRRGEDDLADAALARLRAVRSADQLPDHDYAVATRLLDRGDHAGAIALLSTLVAAYEARGQTKRVGDCELYRGVAHHGAGETHQAESAYVRAMTAYTTVDDAAAVESVRHNLNVLRGNT